MGRANDALEHFTRENYKKNVSRDKFGVQTIGMDFLAAQPREIGIRLLEKMIFCGSGERGGGELAQRERLFVRIFEDDFTGEVIAGCGVELERAKLIIFREASRIEDKEIMLEPGKKITWDQRFGLQSNGEQQLRIKSAATLSRQQLQALIPDVGHIRMRWVRSVPIVFEKEGNALAIGAYSFGDEVSSELVNFNV